MATVNQSQQSFAERDPAVAAASSNARRDSSGTARGPSVLRDSSAKTVHSEAAEVTYSVVLRLADVSTPSPAEELVHVTQLQIESAQESIGSGKAAYSSGPTSNTAIPAANSYASLLAASPSLQSGRTVDAGEVNVPSHTPETDRPIAPPVRSAVAPYQATPVEAVTEPTPVASPRTQQRIDRPAIKPLRRPFKITRPAWMPEIPPTLVVGMLICFSALLIGMLWSGNDHDSPSHLHPAVHDKPVPKDGAAAPAKVAAVPKVPEVPKRKGRGKSAAEVTAAKPSAKKLSQAKPPKSDKIADKVSQLPSEAQSAVEGIPAPRITGIRALPPVEAYTQDKFYGQPIGGPVPQIVENPHVTGPNAVYEARRPPVQFQGNITPPDAAPSNERFR